MYKFTDNQDGKGIFFIQDNKNIYVSEEQKEKLSQGCEYINGEITETEEHKTSVSNKQIDEIKQKCNKEILEKYSYTDQINMGAEIQEIHLVARLEKREFTDTEMLKVGEAVSMKYWIDEKRVECADKISEL